MHALFGVSPETFADWLKADPTLRKACEEGVERQALHRTLKHHHGYAPAAVPTKGKVDVNVNARGGVMLLPPETTLEEWEKQTAQAQAQLKERVRD